MSIEEARQISISFRELPLMAPPPRTLDDLMTTLQLYTPPDNSSTGTAQPRPQGDADPGQLAMVYFRRGIAARDSGRVQEEIANLREAAKWAKKGLTNSQEGMEILYRYALAESFAGDPVQSIQITRDALDRVPSDLRGWLFTLNAHLARTYAAMGDLRAATRAAAETDRVLVEAGRVCTKAGEIYEMLRTTTGVQLRS
jgi:tetratricopeptide (TPR) repeat protein